jgi:RNA-binding protein 8A
VSNLHDETTEADINDKFSKYGTVMNMQMPLDRRSGYVKVNELSLF